MGNTYFTGGPVNIGGTIPEHVDLKRIDILDKTAVLHIDRGKETLRFPVSRDAGDRILEEIAGRGAGQDIIAFLDRGHVVAVNVPCPVGPGNSDAADAGTDQQTYK